MNGQVFQNWKIENFSCWNQDVHAKCIKSPIVYFSYCKYIELYPRGLSGLSDHLVVRFCEIKTGFSGGELSFIGSDKSIICTLQVNRVNSKNNLYCSLGPKYEDVTALIRKKAAEEEDQLTLQFIPPSGKICEQRMCTTISVLKYSLGIDKNFIESVKSDSEKIISFSSSSHTEEGIEGIFFKIARQNERVQLKLELIDKDEEALLVESCMRLLSHNNDLLSYEENRHVFRCNEPWTFSDSPKYKELVDESNTLNMCFIIVKGDMKKRYNHLLYSPKGITIIQNTNVCVQEETSFKCFDSSNQLENPVSALTEELMCLFQDQDFSDLQLTCETVSFPVHKNILSARSPVFKTMLSSDMIEAASSSVDIEDLDAPTLARFLVFLYSGSVDDLQGDTALKLYYAADKYQVLTLKMTCAAFLRANVTISSVCDILSLADRHQDEELLSAARDFLLNNLNEVSRSEEWRSFMKKEPLLAVETMTYFIAKDFVIKKGDPQ